MKPNGRRPPEGGLLFAFSRRDGIIIQIESNRQGVEKAMTNGKNSRQTKARILALVIAGVMTLSIVLSMVLK